MTHLIMQKVAIIIVNYKDYARHFLPECIESLRLQETDGWQWQLYIVDNAATAQSESYLRRHAPEAVIIPRTDGNYAAANNAGIAQAKADGCGFFVIANMDMVFDRRWLVGLVHAAGQDPAIGIVQSKVLLHENGEKTDRINTVGNIWHFLGFGFTRGYREIDAGQHDAAGEIAGYASGSALGLTAAAVETLGGYDETYYMYHDDLELGWRATLAGYRIVLAPQSVCWHKYEFSRSVRMLYYMERNRYLAIFSFFKLPTLLLILPPLLAMELGMAAYAIKNGWLFTKLRADWYFLQPNTWLHIWRVRRSAARYRVLDDRDIAATMSGRVEYQEIMNPLLQYVVNPAFDWYWKLVKRIMMW